MTQLLGPNGLPISSSNYAPTRGRPKTPKPVVGNLAAWENPLPTSIFQLPGGGAIQFDTSRLTLGDFRRMRENYQIGSSIRLLTFMMHQTEWTIRGGTARTRSHVEENLRKVWTPLVRSMASAFPFGYSANAVEWENAPNGRVVINKFKDLVHEEVDVHWKYEDATRLPGDAPGSIQPKVKIFDGIEQFGKKTIPVSNSFWYPLLMENGDYKGTKLLRNAFQPWFFSNLIHMFANRYYERFGEPVPIGRAPYDEDIEINGTPVPGNQVMQNILMSLRNRSAVVLPNQRTQDGLGGVKSFDYDISFLESQMRGADWERYMTRLDEEMSLALFTPLMILRTTDQGGFNQGVGHTQVYLWMLNAIAGDWKEYIDRYIVAPMVRYNFGLKEDIPTIHFRKLGTAQQETLRAVVQSLLGQNKIKVDIEELGAHIGLDIEEIEELERDESDADPDNVAPNGNKDGRVGRPERTKDDDPKNILKPKQTTDPITQRIAERVRGQTQRASSDGTVNEDFEPSLGFARQLTQAFEACGVDEPAAATARVHALVTGCMADLRRGSGGISADDYMAEFTAILDLTVEKVVNG